jgi:putative transposase
MGETYIKVGGDWKYLYRAVDKAGNTVDFLLTAKRDRAAAQRFLTRAIGNNALPTTITIDQSGANAGIVSYSVEHDTAITIRQWKYLNNIVEQDHRAVKRITRGMLGFKSFRYARVILGGIEIMHMICKGQLRSNDGSMLSAAQQFYSLAA